MGKDQIKTLSAQVGRDEYERYKALSAAQGMTLSAWVKQSLSMMYPQEMLESQMATAKGTVARSASVGASVMGMAPITPSLSDTDVLAMEDALTASFRHLDSQEQNGTPGMSIGVSAPSVATPQGPPIVRGSHDHPCRFLDPTPPPNMTPADCQGTCQKQRGRACHWGAQVASQCGYYRPK